MKITRRKKDGLVQYAFHDSEDVVLTTILERPVKALDIKWSTHEIITVNELPEYFIPGMFGFNDGDWTVLKESEYVDCLKTLKAAEAKKTYETALYSDITVEFPDGPGVIQFRNEIDRANISNAVLHSLLISQETIVTFKTKDNKVRTLTAQNMQNIGKIIFTLGQKKFRWLSAVKEQIEEAQNLADLINVNVKEVGK